jgi:hypothetical protein
MIRHLREDQTEDVASDAGRTPTEATCVTNTVEPVPVHPRFGRRGQLRASPIECGASPMECGASPMECGASPMECGASLIECGASLIEYVLMIAMVALVCIGALTYFGGTSGNSADRSAQCIMTAGTPTYDCP